MAEARSASPVKLFVGMLSGRPDLFALSRARLEREYGAVDAESGMLPFDFTDYYKREMGPDLKRQFLAFAPPIPPDALPAIKRRTNELEAEIAREMPGVPRPVNLDPGYLTLSKVVLATTKDYSHRVYLRDGIFAEVTLVFRKGAWQPWPWTYPDYATEGYLAFFTTLRRRWKAQGGA